MLIDHRLHLFSPCRTAIEGAFGKLDVGGFAERLLTFDRYTIHSAQCSEVEGIVASLGLNTTRRLIESEVIRIYDGAATVASLARDFYTRPRPLPPLHYSLHLQLRDDFEQDPIKSKYISEHVAQLKFRGAHYGASQAFKKFLRSRIVGLPGGLGDIVPAALADLQERKDLLRLAIYERLRREGLTTSEFELAVQGNASFDDPLRVTTDLHKRLPMTKETLHAHIEQAVLAVVRLSQEIAFMRGLGAVGALPEDDVSLFRAKLDSVVASSSDSIQEQLTRVLRLAAFPDLAYSANTGQLDMHKLVTLRDTDEAKEFRKWLRHASLYSDEDLERLLNGLRARLALIMGTPIAKLAFIALCTILPLPLSPGLAFAAGPAAGLLDAFVLQKVFAAPGPALFVQRIGRSLFLPYEHFELSPDYRMPNEGDK